MVQQLTIPFLLEDNFKFDLFVSDNWQANAILEWCLKDSLEPFCWLWGGSGTGKTHVLNSVCHLNVGSNSFFYLNLNNYKKYNAEILHGLDKVGLVCLDNVEAIFGDLIWETSLFSLYNDLIINNKAKLLVSAALPFESYNILLSDLRSRVASGWQLELRPIREDLLLEALILRSRACGFNLPEAVAKYLVLTIGSCSHCLFSFLAVLAKNSLQHQRKLSVVFVKQCMHLFDLCSVCKKDL